MARDKMSISFAVIDGYPYCSYEKGDVFGGYNLTSEGAIIGKGQSSVSLSVEELMDMGRIIRNLLARHSE